jgi:hypothetical protein
MKFISSGVLYSPGDILPDTESARNLMRQGKAQRVEDSMRGMQDETAVSALEGYGNKSAKTLADLAKERGIDIPKGSAKAEIIELLEAWDADRAEGGNNEGDA